MGRKRGFEDEGLYVVIGEICPLGCWEFQTGELWYIFSSCTYQHKSVAGHFSFPKGGRLERDLIQFSKESMHDAFPISSLRAQARLWGSLSRPRPASLDQPQPASKKHTHKSYIIIPGKTPLTQDCSFFSQLRSQPGTRSCEFPIFSVAPFCIRVYLKKFIFPLKILPS